MKIDVHCNQCGEGPKPAEHLFFQCERAKMIWKLDPLSWDDISLQTRSFKEWWIEHGKAGDNEEMRKCKRGKSLQPISYGTSRRTGMHGFSTHRRILNLM